MALFKVVTKEELLEYLNNWQVLWYAVCEPDDYENKENNIYDYVYLSVELGVNFRIIDDHKVLKLIVNLSDFSKEEVTDLVISVKAKAITNWLDVFESMIESNLEDIEEIWSNK